MVSPVCGGIVETVGHATSSSFLKTTSASDDIERVFKFKIITHHQFGVILGKELHFIFFKIFGAVKTNTVNKNTQVEER